MAALAVAVSREDRANRVALNPGLLGNPANALALPAQDLYFHLKSFASMRTEFAEGPGGLIFDLAGWVNFTPALTVL